MSFWQNEHVLVTGATGLLGPHLVEELVSQGAHVVCLVRDWVPESRLMKVGLSDKVRIVRGPLEDLQTCLRALNEYEVSSVFHLGAQAIVGVANQSPLSTFEANIKGTWTLMEACRLLPKWLKRVVIASSDKAYGVQENLPYTEEAPLLGTYPYDASKACGDIIAKSYHTTYGLPVAITRCGNLYGHGDNNYNRIIPGTVRSVLQNEKPIIRSDGSFVRDYFYVKDAVDAYLTLAQALPDDKLNGEAFNFSTNHPLSVVEIVNLVLKLMDREDLEPVIQNQAANEIPEQYLDCAKAERLLNWKPAFGLEEGLRQTIDWYREQLA